MKIEKIYKTLIMIGIILLIVGCSSKTGNFLHNPDKIIVIVDENQKELEKGKDEYSEKVFDRIIELVKLRTIDTLELVATPISDETIKEAKRNAVVLIFNNPISGVLNNGNSEKIKYTEFILSTEKKYETVGFIKQIDGHYIPIGLKDSLENIMRGYIDIDKNK